MATQSLALLFLIEGNLQPSYISVPYYHSDDPLVTIDDLRKAIFEYHCKDLASSYENLTKGRYSSSTSVLVVVASSYNVS